MSLTPDGKLGLGLTTGVLVYGIYQMQMPTATDIRMAEAGQPDVQAAERGATWMSAAVVSGIALVAKSPEVFVIGGVFTVGLAWMYRHADTVNPITKKAVSAVTADQVAQAQMPAAPPAVSAAPQFAAVI
jgi:hypothetical protein